LSHEEEEPTAVPDSFICARDKKANTPQQNFNTRKRCNTHTNNQTHHNATRTSIKPLLPTQQWHYRRREFVDDYTNHIIKHSDNNNTQSASTEHPNTTIKKQPAIGNHSTSGSRPIGDPSENNQVDYL
jgi:hypothetical protein